jgi:hypothetical protein
MAKSKFNLKCFANFNFVEFSMIVTNVNNIANKNLQVGLMIIAIYCAVKCTIRPLEPEAGRKKIKNNQH